MTRKTLLKKLIEIEKDVGEALFSHWVEEGNHLFDRENEINFTRGSYVGIHIGKKYVEWKTEQYEDDLGDGAD